MSRHDEASTTRRSIERVDAATVAAARSLPAATLHEAGGKIGALPSAIKPVAPGMHLCGPAVTVHSPGGDNLWLHRAFEVAQPGDVMVVYASGAYEHGYWGEVMATAAQVRGLAGLVIDACVRDGALLAGIGFPVFSRGLCIRGTSKDFAHFLDQAYASSMEVVSELEVASQLGYLPPDARRALREDLFEIAAMLTALKKTVLARTTS